MGISVGSEGRLSVGAGNVMFGDERPSCPDLAAIMLEWVRQYRDFVSIEYQVHANFTSAPYIIARPSIGNTQVIGWFASDFSKISLMDAFGKYTGELIPEDPLFFQKLDARVEEVLGPSHG